MDWLSVKETVADELDKQLGIEQNHDCSLQLETLGKTELMIVVCSLLLTVVEEKIVDVVVVVVEKNNKNVEVVVVEENNRNMVLSGSVIEMWQWWWWRENNRNGVTISHGRRGRLSFRCSIKKSAVVWENEERLPVK